MELRILCFLAIFLLLDRACSQEEQEGEESTGSTETMTPEEHKILIDCQHPDYRTYIKCLKYHNQSKHHKVKRHHHQYIADSPEMVDQRCLTACHQQCAMVDSNKDCNKDCGHCIKKTKRKHQIITEYETECTSEGCKGTDDKIVAPNITTSIDITNVIKLNTTGGSCSNCTCCPTCNCPIVCCIPSPRLHPSLTVVPQISLGLGLGFSPSFDCLYPWLCPPNAPSPNCSQCENPFLRRMCDPSCLPRTGSNQMPLGF